MFWCLPWYTPRLERMKLKTCRNLIQYYIGNFLEQQLTLDQLSVNIYKGTGIVADINLDCETINKLGEEQEWPVEVHEGHMDDITVHIPWQNLLEKDSIFKINGLSLTLETKARAEPVSSILSWVLSNYSKISSADYFNTSNSKDDKNQESGTEQPAKPFEESFNAIFKRLKIKLENTKFKIEHVPIDLERGFALVCSIKNIDYWDECSSELIPRNACSKRNNKTESTISNTCFSKKIRFEGITLFMQMHKNPDNRNSQEIQRFYNDCPCLDSPKTERQVSDLADKNGSNRISNEPKEVKDTTGVLVNPESGTFISIEKVKPSDPVLFAMLNEQQGLTLTYTKTDETGEPKVEIQTIGSFVIAMSPKDLDTIIEALKSLQHPP